MRAITFLLILIAIAGCKSIVLEPADFAWPIESVLTVNKNGTIEENRYSFQVNVKPLFDAERSDSTGVSMESVRIIRGEKGYYYMIAPGFKNLYIFTVNNGQMVLYNQIHVSETGIELPALNQRKPYIELLDGERHLFYVNNEGIKENSSETK